MCLNYSSSGVLTNLTGLIGERPISLTGDLMTQAKSPDRIPLRVVTLNTNLRPIFNQTYFVNRDQQKWKMFLEGDTVHVIDQSKSGSHAVLHLSSCSVELDGETWPMKPRRGRPPGRATLGAVA